MSQLQPKIARPRRASRAPIRLGDENSAASTANINGNGTGNPRLIGKTSNASLAAVAGTRASGQVTGKATVSISSTATHAGKLAVGTSSIGVTGAARKALGDVSNANARINVVNGGNDRLGVKDSLNIAVSKPVAATSTGTGRSRQASGSSQAPLQPPSSTGTGLSRLKIGSSAGPSKTTRCASRVPTNPPGVKGPGAVVRGGEWASKFDDDDRVELLQNHATAAAAGLGIGIHADGRHDWVAEQMEAQQAGVAYLPPSSSIASPSNGVAHKRAHVDLERDDDDLEAGPGDRYEEGDDEDDEDDGVGSKVRIVDPAVMADPDDWVANVQEVEMEQSERVLELVRRDFDEQLDYWDTTMVAEYSEEIFEYMGQLEEACMPNPRYMEHQTEIEWNMRTTLIDWLLQVHMRYHMLPETLWIAVNLVDRFLSNRVVSLVKFQLVGVTAMFVAAKYEEIMAPSVDEFVFMTEGGYTREEILKGERIILQSLEFNVSPYCSPYSWVRRISKADDYDIQTRTLSKFLMEVTLLDHRFLRAKPSMIAAIGMYLARRMLGGEWNESFIYYSGYTEAQLLVPSSFLLESIIAPEFDQKFVYKKYANKKFLKASIFSRSWALQNHSAAATANEARNT